MKGFKILSVVQEQPAKRTSQLNLGAPCPDQTKLTTTGVHYHLDTAKSGIKQQLPVYCGMMHTTTTPSVQCSL